MRIAGNSSCRLRSTRSAPSNHHLKRVILRAGCVESCLPVCTPCCELSCTKIQPRPRARKCAARFSDSRMPRTTQVCTCSSLFVIHSWSTLASCVLASPMIDSRAAKWRCMAGSTDIGTHGASAAVKAIQLASCGSCETICRCVATSSRSSSSRLSFDLSTGLMGAAPRLRVAEMSCGFGCVSRASTSSAAPAPLRCSLHLRQFHAHGLAPRLSSSFVMRGLWMKAQCRAVWPLWSTALIFAPMSSKTSAHASSSYSHARISGVKPSLFEPMSMSASAWISSRQVPGLPLAAAPCSAVSPRQRG
mmetsp:Transcript_9258/g.29358  ORF Transcript_9258/g.29358 Transcript_9258/m.29358 type:complete len:304 (+) Transcript_9258:587-1498(+)